MTAARKTRRGWESRLFLTVKDVADILEVDPRTVRRAIDAGQIPAVRISESVIRIPTARFRAEVLGLATESTEPAPATGAGPDNVHPIAPATTGGFDGKPAA